ncbi:MAG: hypothetical protein AAF716_14305 [Cyanobacteria bacterium P01_D01_bin.1]
MPEKEDREQPNDKGQPNDREQLNRFLAPTSKYQGEFTPQNLAFNANLQEFAQRVSLICGLETGGKVSSTEAYENIKKLWKDLKASKKNLIEED